ncbi:MAG TPA: hypothetical protein QF873_03275 [Patescibacteria group bacterium]|nr:hypothetical protein [Patescibacteria group bacterium]|tara:strand:- start:91 stop:459 length:369 start_codon:yes stop_codon:yes gene_type:complete
MKTKAELQKEIREELKKKLKIELDELRKSFEKITWEADDGDYDKVTATLTEPPFAGWRLKINASMDKWDQGALEYWILPNSKGPHTDKHAGGPGYWSRDAAEVALLKRLVRIKEVIDNEDRT